MAYGSPRRWRARRGRADLAVIVRSQTAFAARSTIVEAARQEPEISICVALRWLKPA